MLQSPHSRRIVGRRGSRSSASAVAMTAVMSGGSVGGGGGDAALESTRDYLYRTLYLRREYGLLTSLAALQTARELRKQPDGTDDVEDSETSVATAAVDKSDVRDVLLLPPPSALSSQRDDMAARPRHDSSSSSITHVHDSTASDTAVVAALPGWPGLVFVRQRTSPWCGGCFAFTVHFPARYPFECPVIELATPLPSHPLVRIVDDTTAAAVVSRATHTLQPQQQQHHHTRRRYIVPFEHVYCRLDPMHVSVMARLLQHMKVFFGTDAWPASWWQPRRRAPSLRSPAPHTAHDDQGRGGGERVTTADAGDAAVAAAARRRDDGSDVDDDEEEDMTARTVVVDRVLAQRDVRQHSVTQEVMLGRPYTDYLCGEVAAHLATLAATSPSSLLTQQQQQQQQQQQHCSSCANDASSAEAHASSQWASWYTRHVLPTMAQLP